MGKSSLQELPNAIQLINKGKMTLAGWRKDKEIGVYAEFTE